ncbi:MAG TPA: hypothetical protein VK011_08535 [Acidimicrobiia bacterium]|nr:hypothetical protein [Acidimicrobiia bacterium]
MDRHEPDARPGLDSDHQPPAAPHSITATVADPAAARLLVEELEERGVPPGSIEMSDVVSPEEDEANEAMPESRAFVDVSKSSIAGGAIGAVIGGALGAILGVIVPDLGMGWAILIGAVFGIGVGGSAGGMAVAKYNSPAWRETYETVDRGRVTVGVHDGDPEVIDTAEEVMRSHELTDLRRRDT